MKRIIQLLLSVILLIWGCSNNPVNSPQGNGKIQLKIDKENAPVGIVLIESLLSREGYDNIISTLNLISDSTADILINDIPVGEWHLKIDAKDSLDTVLYTGETDVEIFAGFVTQVNLVLRPTGEGMGSIYIYVTWGVSSTINWIDFENNPILTALNSYQFGILQPVVLKVNNTFRMWYTGLQSAAYTEILYGESRDGISWETNLNQPVLSPGAPGTWDSWSVQSGAVIYENEIYKLYYFGYADPYGGWHIGLATSTDGINWEKYRSPILYGQSGMEYQIAVSSVVKDDDVYYLYYTIRNQPEYKIGLATSTDGVNWSRYEGNPILRNTEPWEDNGIYEASIIIENGQFKMMYMNTSSTAFGAAYSSDGIHWIKSNSNPFFTKENTSNNWAADRIAYPNLIKLETESRIYYSGIKNQGGPHSIGFVRGF